MTTSAPRAPSDDAPFRLITIPFSHFCEKARWALDRSAVPYREEGHPPMLHWGATAPLRKRTVPVLVSRAGVFSDSTDILRYVDGFAPIEARLFSDDLAARREVEALEDEFDERLGPAVRRWAYGYLLDEPALLRWLFARGVGPFEGRAAELAVPVLARVMRRGLGITPKRVARSVERMEQIFAKVDRLLADGRRFLVGDRFSAADLTFAALAVPLLAPDEYGGPLPPLERLPAAMRADIERYRARPAGQFILRLYREERGRVVTG